MVEEGVVTMATTLAETNMVLEEALIDTMKVATEEDMEGVIRTLVAQVEDHHRMADGVAEDAVVVQSEVEVAVDMILSIDRETRP
jgi:hypothetical protein